MSAIAIVGYLLYPKVTGRSNAIWSIDYGLIIETYPTIAIVVIILGS